MKIEHLGDKIQSLQFQRNAFLLISVLLSALSLIMGVAILFKNERVVIVPAIVDKEFWVDSTGVSSTYLEQYSLFITGLILGKTGESSRIQEEALLRHVDVRIESQIRKRLEEEREMLRERKASYVFFPVDVKVFPKDLRSEITGDRIFYVEGRPVNTKRDVYELTFSYDGARLLLQSVTHKE